MSEPSDTPAAPDVGEIITKAIEACDEALADYKADADEAYISGERPDLWDPPEVTLSEPLVRALCSALAASAAETARLREERDGLASKVYAPDGGGWKQHAIDLAKERPYDRAQVLVLQSRAEHAEARALSAEAENVKLREAWDWLAAHVNLELDWDEIDEGEAAWRVHRVGGGRNDREWELIATGGTPLEAVQAARAALKQPDSEEG